MLRENGALATVFRLGSEVRQAVDGALRDSADAFAQEPAKTRQLLCLC